METNYKKCSNFKKRSYVLKNSFFVLIIILFFSPTVILAHDGEEPKEKVEKVTEKMLQKQEKSQDTQTQKDLAEITKTVKNGTVPTVIKALSLAVFIAGFAFLYLPKKKREVPNGQ